jgi:hypothetical protein
MKGNLDGRLPDARAIADACPGRRERVGPAEPLLVRKHPDVHPPEAGSGAGGEQVRAGPEPVHPHGVEVRAVVEMMSGAI